MPGEAVASTPGAKLGGLVVGDGSVVVPWQARVLGTRSLARSGGTCVKACGLLVEPEKPTEAGLVVWASKPSERVKAAWAKSRRHGVQSARALAGGQDTSQHRGFGGFPQNRHPSSGFPGIPQNHGRLGGSRSRCTWRHREACVKAKQSREGVVFVR